MQNDPVNFTDPSGLLRVQECTRNWWTDANGERHYLSWMCVTVYDDGGGYAGEGNGLRGSKKQTSTIPENYRRALQKANLLAKVEALLKTTKVIDVNKIQNEMAYNQPRYFDYYYRTIGFSHKS